MGRLEPDAYGDHHMEYDEEDDEDTNHTVALTDENQSQRQAQHGPFFGEYRNEIRLFSALGESTTHQHGMRRCEVST